uniref:Centriolar satellite-associated tubulin polyglutamylase complex regulator 1 n=1 Tax=Meleagris gallopavo TaxID=9103 RepID=A0A803YNX8_MELGA
ALSAQRHVLTYMEDAVSQLLENREDISQYGIARFFTEYAVDVDSANHCMFCQLDVLHKVLKSSVSFIKKSVGNGCACSWYASVCLLMPI